MSEIDKSLLNQTRYNLALNEDLVVVGEIFQVTHKAELVEAVNIFIRPDQDLGLDGKKLSEFHRQTIDPILRPLFRQAYETRIDRPFYGGLGTYPGIALDLQFGYFSLDEIIGRKRNVSRIELELFDKEARARLIETEGEEFISESTAATRLIRVYILPNDSIAKLVLAYEQGLNQGLIIPDKTLELLKHGLTREQVEMISCGQNPLPEVRYR